MPGSSVEAAQIPVFAPLLESEELDAAREALELGWLGMGSYVGEFEREIAKLIEASDRRVAAVSTGHAALHLGLLLAGAGPGTEVITPSFNNVADFQAILATGAEPVLCDVRDDTLCIDVERAAELVGPATVAIIPTDYACALCDHDALAQLAEREGLRVLHDAAHSLGSRHRGRPTGSFSDMTMFSFDPVKTVTSIDGGALVVRTEGELERLHEMRLIGMGQRASEMYGNRRAWTYDVTGLGFRYHMANLHAAVGIAQIRKLPRIARARRDACRAYNEGLAGLEEVRTPATDFEDVIPFLYFVRVPASRRDDLREHLAARGVDTGIHWQPGHAFSLLRDCRRGDMTVTDRAASEILTLPLHSDPAPGTVERVVDGVASFFDG
ncbi:MAG TPA: DegT/DnrJ/EryC1/StrS family aminotransferase [Thermoleophilaceae bacterium]